MPKRGVIGLIPQSIWILQILQSPKIFWLFPTFSFSWGSGNTRNFAAFVSERHMCAGPLAHVLAMAANVEEKRLTLATTRSPINYRIQRCANRCRRTFPSIICCQTSKIPRKRNKKVW
ncbi:hypothetical protein Y032_0169g230 [Ancylostoma ceylanicum]|uniref:Uncharacterized protein n=1 Tax=Ancylostoma ceylanicum TaxID=53326 RepID=A0A016SVV8_9BILA|nr:hypothetical protein Y032_0169g230 [Ancylostoma ceylanicum]